MTDKKISGLELATTPLTSNEVLPIVQAGVTVKVAVYDLTRGVDVAAKSITLLGSGSGNVANFQFPALGTVGGVYVDSGGIYIGGGTHAYTNAWGASHRVDKIHALVAGVERFSIDTDGNITPSVAAKGVNFTANTPAAGMTSQLLNWYEEGTFTPTITGYSTPGVGTYTTQLGTYTRVGNVVNFAITITQTAHTGAGVMLVNGLPFTIGGPSGSIYAASARSSNLALTALNVLQIGLGAGFTNFALEQVPVGGGAAANVLMDVAFDLSITGSYFV